MPGRSGHRCIWHCKQSNIRGAFESCQGPLVRTVVRMAKLGGICDICVSACKQPKTRNRRILTTKSAKSTVCFGAPALPPGVCFVPPALPPGVCFGPQHYVRVCASGPQAPPPEGVRFGPQHYLRACASAHPAQVQ